MIIGSHLEKSFLIYSNNESHSGFKNFPANTQALKKYEIDITAQQKHIYANIEIDFEKNNLLGTCYIIFESKVNEIKNVLLNANELNIKEVSFCKTKISDLFYSEKNQFPNYKKIEDNKFETCHFINENGYLNLLSSIFL